MADELGTAVLRLELDTSGLKEGLAKAKQQVEQELGTATTGTSRTRRTPPSTRVTAKGGARESTDAVERANQRIIGVQNRINVLEAKGVDISQARARLSQAITANSQRNFDTVRQVTSQLSNTLKIEEGRLRVSELQTAQLKRQAAAEKAATGTATQKAQKPTGVGFATTPEQILASRGGTQKGAAESLSARVAAGDKLIGVQNRLNILEAKGLDVSRQRAAFQQALTAANSEQLGTAQQITQSLSRQISIDENSLKVANLRAAAEKRRLTDLKSVSVDPAAQGPVSPIGGLKTLPGSPVALDAERKLTAQRERAAKATQRAEVAERKKQIQLRKDVAANAIIGVGFPLLFGQGLGAAAGGGIGGAAGALGGGTFGFAGSIAGTAIGAQLDLFIEKSKVLGRALTSPIASFSEIQQASLLSSSGLERQIESLIAVGRSAEAAALIQQDLASRYSATTLAQVTASKKQEDEANRGFTQITTTIGAFAGELGARIQEAFRRIAEPGFGIFSPERLLPRPDQDQGTAVTTTGVRLEKERSTLLSQQFKLITAQAQGYDIVALRLQKDISLGQQRLDIENLIAAKGATGDPAKQAQIEAEIQDRINKGTLERFNLDERILKVAKDKNRENAKALSIEAATVESLRNNRLAAIDIEAKQIRNTAVDTKESSTVTAAKLATLDIRRLAVQQDIERAAFSEFQTREQISRSIGNTLQLLGTEQGQYRDTLGTIQQISDTIDAARRKEADIGFQIDQARVGGRDEEAARLVDQQRTAALETRQRFVEGARSLKEAGESVRANITSATQSLQSLKLSNLRFLSPGEQRETLNQLQRDFVGATQQRGFTPRITGTREQIIQEKQAFVDFTRQEIQLTKAIDQGNRALIEINTRLSTQFESLVSTIPGLTEATTALVAKNWTVSLNVVNNADGSKTINSINSLS